MSCNPVTQARDVQWLSEGYRVTQIQPVDMFPQTFHIEQCVKPERDKEAIKPSAHPHVLRPVTEARISCFFFFRQVGKLSEARLLPGVAQGAMVSTSTGVCMILFQSSAVKDHAVPYLSTSSDTGCQ